MLLSISISNYALIDELNIRFDKGLTIITGETGAGKSILLGAMSLILGERADTSVLQDKSKKCTVEAEFDLTAVKFADFFKRNDLDESMHCIIRREVNPEGKSRAFINDTPVNLSVLKELSQLLIDVHSQHETLILNNSQFQLSVLDAYAQNTKTVDDYATHYAKYKKLALELDNLLASEAQSKKDLDYFQFQYNELENAGLENIDLPALESELQALNNAEEIKTQLSQANNALSAGEVNLISGLSSIKQILSQLAKYNKNIAELSERVSSSLIELKDVSRELESVEEDIVFDPRRIEELTNKIDEINALLLKHRVQNCEQLIEIRNTLSLQLHNIASLDEQILKLKREVEKNEIELTTKARSISKTRLHAIPEIEKEVKKLLSTLCMPDALLKIKSKLLDKLTANGLDEIVFLFSANKGSEPKELNKVASGGELSRFMLSIKALIAKLTKLPTIIFDEIDTGVSGDVANKVGEIMYKMGTAMQVITITHLPQIAGKGKSHLFVFKEVKNGKTFTRIKELNSQERVYEIARMLSTDNPSEAAIKNAKELLKV